MKIRTDFGTETEIIFSAKPLKPLGVFLHPPPKKPPQEQHPHTNKKKEFENKN